MNWDKESELRISFFFFPFLCWALFPNKVNNILYVTSSLSGHQFYRFLDNIVGLHSEFSLLFFSLVISLFYSQLQVLTWYFVSSSFKCFSFSLQILFILSFTTHKYSYSHKSFKGLLKVCNLYDFHFLYFFLFLVFLFII